MVNKIFIFITLFCTLVFYGYADMSGANNLFLSSDYKGAINKYLELISKGEEDADLFFNLATSYLYNGEYGNAIYWYYRTMILEGKRVDTERNLKAAIRGLEEQGIASGVPDSILYEFLIKYYHPSITIVFIVLVNVVFFILILKRVMNIKGGVNAFLIIASILTLVLGIYVGARLYFVNIQERGVVISKGADLKEGPADVYRTVTKVDEGSFVRIRESYGEFLLVELINRNVKGWVNKKDIGILQAGRL